MLKSGTSVCHRDYQVISSTHNLQYTCKPCWFTYYNITTISAGRVPTIIAIIIHCLYILNVLFKKRMFSRLRQE